MSAEAVPLGRTWRGLPSSAWLFVLWLVAFGVVPFALILGMSFATKTGPGSLSWSPTLENYLRCIEWTYARVLLKTLWVASVATLGCLALGFPVAYFLAQSKGVWRKVGLILLFIPFWTSFILRVHGLVTLLGNNGLLNQALMSLGVIDSPLELLYTRTGVYIGLLYNYLPFLVVPVFSSLEKMDPALREAAHDLGADRIKTFLRVTLPNVKEGIAAGALFVFIPMLGEYVIPDLLGGARESFLGNVMVNQFFVMQDWPFGSSIAGLLAALLLGTLILLRGSRDRTEARFDG